MGWTDQLLTGIQEIDAQHQTLFDSISRLEQAVTGAEKWDAVHYALTDLADFVRIHFAVEESLMHLHDYPDIAAHIVEHHHFAQKVADFTERSVRVDVTSDMVEFLRTWLAHHIGEVDHAYVPHLRTQPVARAA
jgi:hemerythrin-like metal-binding protein